MEGIVRDAMLNGFFGFLEILLKFALNYLIIFVSISILCSIFSFSFSVCSMFHSSGLC